MDIYSWIIENKELLKFVYALIVAFICLIIVVKTDRIFRISMHQGIRYFRNAFFFYGLGFLAWHHVGLLCFYGWENQLYYTVMQSLFEFFLIMAGFSLFYSLVWKKFELPGETSPSSLLNKRFIIFYALALVIVILDYLWQPYLLMFPSQIILFICASAIAYSNYKIGGKKHKFLKFYFLAMLLNLAAWTLNLIAATLLNWHQGVRMGIYGLNIIVFLLFLYGVVKLTKKSNSL